MVQQQHHFSLNGLLSEGDLRFEEYSFFLKVLDDLLTAFKTVHAFIFTGLFIHRAIFMHDKDALQIVTVPDFEVIRIMSRSNFDRA